MPTGQKVAKTLATAIGGAFVAGKIKGFVQEGIEGLKAAEVARAQTAVQIKATGGAAGVSAEQVSALSREILDMSGVSTRAGINVLLTFTKIRNEVGKNNDIFDQATKAAADLSVAGFGPLETTSKLLGKALNDPVIGMTALQRVGIRLTDDQKELVKQLVATGDVLEAQKIILGEVTDKVGGSAKAYGETLAGQLDIAQASLDRVQRTMVEATAPALELGAKAAIFMADQFERQPEILQQIEGGFILVAGAVSSVAPGLVSAIDLYKSFGGGAKAAAAAADLSGPVLNSSNAVDDLYSSTGRFTGGVGRMATAVTGAGIQLGILYGALQLVGGSSDHADLPKLTKDILDFARGGAIASEGAADFGGDLDGLGRAVERIAAPSGLTKAENLIDGLGRALGDTDDDLSQARARVDDLDKALASIAQRDPAQAAAALKSITGAMDPATAARLLTLLDDYDGAVAEAGVSSTIAAGKIDDVGTAASDTEGPVDDLADGTDDLTVATKESARATKTWADRMDEARTKIDELFGAVTSQIEGALDYKDAVDESADALALFGEMQTDNIEATMANKAALAEARKELRDGTITQAEYREKVANANAELEDGIHTLDDFRRATDDAARTLLRQSEVVAQAAEATAGLAGQHLDAGTKARVQKEELQRLATTLAPGDPLRQQLEGFITDLERVPGSKTISFSVEGVDEAVAEIERLMRAGASIPGDVFWGLLTSLGAAGLAEGGLITEAVYRASGGGFPGGPRGSDTVPLWATPGEFMMQKSAVDRWGVGFMEQLNSGGTPMASGGQVSQPAPAGDLLVQNIYTLDPIQAAAESARRHRAVRVALERR